MATICFGSLDIGVGADTVYLGPFGLLPSALSTPIGMRATRRATASTMRVHHNALLILPVDVTYALFINGQESGLTVTLSTTDEDGVDSEHDADVEDGDLLEVVATKAGILASGVLQPIVTFEMR